MHNKTELNKSYVIFSLAAIAGIFLIVNVIDQEQNLFFEGYYITDTLFTIIPIIVIILGILLINRYRLRGRNGIAWMFFTLAISIWFVAENTYDYDVDYDVENLSTFTSDFLWVAGYLIFFIFTILYLSNFKNRITKNLILITTAISLIILSPTFYTTFSDVNEINTLETFLYVLYPILDSIILIPSIIAISLFFKGQVNILWTLILFATIVDVIADTSFLFFGIEESYHPGHLIDILYVWSYVFYAFGAFHNWKLYQIRKSN